MELTERKKKILRAIVDEYIRTAEPVGSKTIAQMPGMDFSSATIRNEMAELACSSSRIPPPGAYRARRDTGFMWTS